MTAAFALRAFSGDRHLLPSAQCPEDLGTVLFPDYPITASTGTHIPF
jgi:hypothetical protein